MATTVWILAMIYTNMEIGKIWNGSKPWFSLSFHVWQDERSFAGDLMPARMSKFTCFSICHWEGWPIRMESTGYMIYIGKNTDYSNCSGYFPSSMGETWWSWPIQLCLELMWECYHQSEVGWYCWRRFMISTYFHKVWNDPAYTWNHQFHIHKQLAPGLFQGTLYDFPWPQNHRPGVRLSFRMLLWLQIGRNHGVFLRKMLHRTDKISEGGLMAPVGILDPSWRAGNQVVKGSCLQSLIIFLWQCSQYKVYTCIYQCPISGTNPAGWFLSGCQHLQAELRAEAFFQLRLYEHEGHHMTAPMTAFRRCLLGRLQYATTATIHHTWSTGHGLEVEKSSCHWHFCPCHSPHYPRLHCSCCFTPAKEPHLVGQYHILHLCPDCPDSLTFPFKRVKHVETAPLLGQRPFPAEDLQLLLQIVRRCPSPMLVAAAAAAGLAILMLWRMKAGGSVGCCADTYQNLRWFGQENMESTIISLIIVKIFASTIKNGLRILPVSNQYCEKLRIYQGEQGELTCQKWWVFTSHKGNSSIKA